MTGTPQNDELTRLTAGMSDAEHLILLNNLSRLLERENVELRQKIADAEEDSFNSMVERNLRDS